VTTRAAPEPPIAATYRIAQSLIASSFGASLSSSPSSSSLPPNSNDSTKVCPSGRTSYVTMLFAQPKCASTCSLSWVAKAIFMRCAPGRISVGRRSECPMCARDRAREIDRVRRQRPVARAVMRNPLDHQVRDLEDQVHGAAIADLAAVRVADPVEHREADAHQRLAQPLGHLPAVRVRDQQIASRRTLLQVLEIAEQHVARAAARARPTRSC
jgi:hypothetical protein